MSSLVTNALPESDAKAILTLYVSSPLNPHVGVYSDSMFELPILQQDIVRPSLTSTIYCVSFFHEARDEMSFHHLQYCRLSAEPAYNCNEDSPVDVGELVAALEKVDALLRKERTVREVEEISDGELLHSTSKYGYT